MSNFKCFKASLSHLLLEPLEQALRPLRCSVEGSGEEMRRLDSAKSKVLQMLQVALTKKLRRATPTVLCKHHAARPIIPRYHSNAHAMQTMRSNSYHLTLTRRADIRMCRFAQPSRSRIT